jgi:hypothetical protein
MHVHEDASNIAWLNYTLCPYSMAFLFVTCDLWEWMAKSCSSVCQSRNAYRLSINEHNKNPTMKKKIKEGARQTFYQPGFGLAVLVYRWGCTYAASIMHVWSDHSIAFWIDQSLAHVPSICGNLITCNNTCMQTIPHHWFDPAADGGPWFFFLCSFGLLLFDLTHHLYIDQCKSSISINLTRNRL